MSHKLSPKEMAQIMHHSKVLLDASLCVIFFKKHKNSAHLLKVFNRGIQRLKDSGKYERYIKESRGGYDITK
jgi:polar amino acid transport system substrate-binding protein